MTLIQRISSRRFNVSIPQSLCFQLPDRLPSLKADKERPQVKVEPGTVVQEKVNEQAVTETKTEKESVFEDIPEGRLGTLRIHKSGKITLQMGEHSFVLDSATQVSYLQVPTFELYLESTTIQNLSFF